MIQYIVAAGVGALLGKMRRTKSFSKGGVTKFNFGGHITKGVEKDIKKFAPGVEFMCLKERGRGIEITMATKFGDRMTAAQARDILWIFQDHESFSLPNVKLKKISGKKAIFTATRIPDYAKGGMTPQGAAEGFQNRMNDVSQLLDRADLALSRRGDFGEAFSAVAEARTDAYLMRKYATFMGRGDAITRLKTDIEALQKNLDQLQRDIKVGTKVEGYNTERPLVGISAAQRRLANIQEQFSETIGEGIRNSFERGGTTEIARMANEDQKENPLPLLDEAKVRKELKFANLDWHKRARLYHDKSEKSGQALMDAWFSNPPFEPVIEEEIYDWGKAWLDENDYIMESNEMAEGGKTQGYNDKLDESLGSRRGAGRTKEQDRKDRRDESEAMEKSMGRRKYAAVGTMDIEDRMMEKGGKVSKFDKLANAVAAQYRKKGFSEKKAQEIGDGTAAKVYREQQAKKS